MYSIRVAQSLDEVSQAFELAYVVFKNSVENEAYNTQKIDLWYNDPSYDISNFILAFHDEKLIGLIRGVPRFFFLNNKRVAVFGLSSVCVDPRYRRCGISNQLMSFSDELAAKRGFSLCLLFARRAVDHYYNKFNYFGISSYSRLSININVEKSDNIFLQLKDYDEELVETYSIAFNYSYGKYFFRADRNKTQWKFFRYILNNRSDLTFKTIYYKDNAIGYLLYSDSGIHEYSILESYDQLELIINISLLIFSPVRNLIQIDISPSHTLNNFLFNLDYTRTIRHCSYGGHMVKIVSNSGHYNSILSENQLKKFIHTKSLMKSFSEYTGNFNINQCIDIPIFDQF